LPYEQNVFVNCPFDHEYREMMHAIVFSVHDCGLVARSALEISDSSQVRIDRILTLIEECQFGIHDISRTELDPAHQLPRFNMPLELGLFLGAKRFGPGRQKEKNCVIMDTERYRFQRFCSDIAGQDIKAHAGDPFAAIPMIRDWIRDATRGSGSIMPGGRRMVDRFRSFRAALPSMCDLVGIHEEELIFNDYTTLAASWLKENEW
jgi:hypothetical protein